MEKHIKTIGTIKAIIASLFITLLLFPSCSDYLDVNDDPDAITQNPGVFLIPSIEISIGSIIGGQLALNGSLWCQYYNQNNTANQYRDEIDMKMTAVDSDVSWDELYSNALSDIRKLKEYSEQEETYNPRLYLIATVLESYTFQYIMDAFGEAPYSEAINGEDEGNFNPVFENGQDVYPKLIAAIDTALMKYNTYLAENTSVDEDLRSDQSSSDYLLGGDLSKWVSFANSVKLKIAMRNLDYDQSGSLAIISALEAENNYLTEDVKLDIFAAEVNKENPLYAQDQNLNTKINLVADRTLSEFLTNNDDPREPLTYEANSNGDLLLDHGDHRATTATNPPNSNRKPIMDPTRPVYFITTSEIDFFRAELAVKGHISSDPKALYEQAVKSAFVRVGATEGEAETLLESGGNYEFSTAAEDRLEDIGVQKWAALANVNPFEGFLEIHRLDYPEILQTTTYIFPQPKGNAGAKLYLPKNSVLGNDYIKRYLLPESEALSNANFPAQTKVTDKLWWDTK